MNDAPATMSPRSLDEITGAVVDAALKIHRSLGPGLLESVYVVVLARALVRQGFKVERQKMAPAEPSGWTPDQLRRRHTEGRAAAHREQPSALIVATPPREPTLNRWSLRALRVSA